MPAIVTDQFRILNASNFVDSIDSNNYYVFIGLPNPTKLTESTVVGYGRSENWNTNPPQPLDSFSNNSHIGDTMMFGKKITSANIRRVIKRVDWKAGTRYEIYRDDYSSSNPSPLKSANRLYDAEYYVMNSDYKVYVCIDNGSNGDNEKGNVSQDEPTFTDLEPSKAGGSGDGYLWKYLYSVSPGDIIKFDSTEYITVPNNWSTSTDPQIRAVRENGDSEVNDNQIKHVYINNGGSSYQTLSGQEVDIVGDGYGAKARVDVNQGVISDVTVSAGGQGYTYGLVDLGPVNSTASGNLAELIPIIPPSKGHGFDIYTELGTDKVLIYARFDDSTKDFPTDTKFSQVGIIKNPTVGGTGGTVATVFDGPEFSSLDAMIFNDEPNSNDVTKKVDGTPEIGEVIEQKIDAAGNIARAYVASFDKETKVLKFFRDRSLNYKGSQNHTDYVGISTQGKFWDFKSDGPVVEGKSSGFKGYINNSYTGITTNPSGTKQINLGSAFTSGLSKSEINKGSGEMVYVDNRPLIARNTRQKEDVKIILEF